MIPLFRLAGPTAPIVRRIKSTRRYEAIPSGHRALAALYVLRDKLIRPLLAAACCPKCGPETQEPDSGGPALQESPKRNAKALCGT
jgi:hypothetical protein